MKLPTAAGYILPFGMLELPQSSRLKAALPPPRPPLFSPAWGISQVDLKGRFFMLFLPRLTFRAFSRGETESPGMAPSDSNQCEEEEEESLVRLRVFDSPLQY